MAATADELMAWWKTFNNGVIVDEEEEVSDSEEEEEWDHDSEDEEVGVEGASTAATPCEVDHQRTAPAARAEKESRISAALHGDEEIPEEDGYVWQLQVGLLGRKKEVVSKPQAIGTEIQDAEGQFFPTRSSRVEFHYQRIKKYNRDPKASMCNRNIKESCHAEGDEVPEDAHVEIGRVEPMMTLSKRQATGADSQDGKGECLTAENEMLRRLLVRKMEELEAEQIQRLKLNLNVKNKEIKSLKKQIGELRAENEHYRKTVSSTCP